MVVVKEFDELFARKNLVDDVDTGQRANLPTVVNHLHVQDDPTIEAFGVEGLAVGLHGLACALAISLCTDVEKREGLGGHSIYRSPLRVHSVLVYVHWWGHVHEAAVPVGNER